MKEELPENIDDWKSGTITNILEAGYYESDSLEFKESLSENNESIGRTACAFANSNGGILIMGISDDRTKSIPERLIGLDKSRDNVSTITNQISKITPQLPSYNVIFKQPSIDLGKNKEVMIIKILKSTIPHQFEQRFFKRLVGKNDFLTHNEIEKKILESKKNSHMEYLMTVEISNIREDFEGILQKNSLITCDSIEHFKVIAIIEFQFNYSYLYDFAVLKNLFEILEIVEKLRTELKLYQSFEKSENKEDYANLIKERGYPDFKTYFQSGCEYFAEIGIKHIKALEKALGHNIKRPTSKYTSPKEGKLLKKKSNKTKK